MGDYSDTSRVLLLNELKKNRLKNTRIIEDLKRELEQLREQQRDQNHNKMFGDQGYSTNVPAISNQTHLGGNIPNMGDPRLAASMTGTTSNGIPLFLPYESNSIASEANLMKMEYINSGGSDPFIIRQLNELIAQGVSEQNAFRDQISSPVDRRQDQITLKILEDYRHENEKLRSELESVKHEKLTDEDELSLLKKDHILKMTQMKQEFEQLQQMAKIKQLKDQVMEVQNTSPQYAELDLRSAREKEMLRLHSKEAPYLMTNANYPINMDSLTLSPYDPATGFMIFHDYILNVDPSYKSIKVVARLFRANLELGTPVPLPERQCLGMHGESYSSSYLHCLIGIKQPVTKCLPTPDLCLLVEIKASTHYEERLKTVCWAKFLLFDDQHRVLSGRWKVPLRVVPVRPDLHPRENNNIPQCGKMEFYYRVCNSRDSETQSKVTAAPNLAYQYIYPPTSFDDAIFVQSTITQPKKPKPAIVQREIKPAITYTAKKK